MASLVCGLSPDSIDQQKKLILEKVGVRLNPFKNVCEFYFKTKTGDFSQQEEQTEHSYFTPVNIALAVISLVLVVTIIVIVFMYIRCKKSDDTNRITTLDNSHLHLQTVSRVTSIPQVESEEYLMLES